MIKSVLVVSVFLIAGCSANSVKDGAEKVKLTTKHAPDGCKYMGEVNGSQGNWFTSDITSDETMIKGARNEMRNQAFELGANYVELNNQSQSEATGLGGANSASTFGNAYKCP